MKIITDYIHPPIPLRDFDYRATYEGYEGGDIIGYGKTEEEAKLDLINQTENL